MQIDASNYLCFAYHFIMPTIQLTSQPIKHSKHFVAFSGEDRCIFNVTIHMNESNMVCNTYSFCRMSQDSGIWSSV